MKDLVSNASNFGSLLQNRFPEAVTSVISNPYGGIDISIVTDDFVDLSAAERRLQVLQLVPSSEIASLRLRTREEDLKEVELDPVENSFSSEKLPLWPEAFASSHDSSEVVVNLPSLNQESLESPIVATFYSLRGGVGRTTALAHTAYALAKQGISVLCIDMDLEAPGLAAMFDVESQVHSNLGVVHLLTQADIRQTLTPDDITDHIIRVDTEFDVSLFRQVGYPRLMRKIWNCLILALGTVKSRIRFVF